MRTISIFASAAERTRRSPVDICSRMWFHASEYVIVGLIPIAHDLGYFSQNSISSNELLLHFVFACEADTGDALVVDVLSCGLVSPFSRRVDIVTAVIAFVSPHHHRLLDHTLRRWRGDDFRLGEEEGWGMVSFVEFSIKRVGFPFTYIVLAK